MHIIETALILAAGKGTRLQPHTYDIPKGFMQVGDEKLIERSVRMLKEQGIKNIMIGTGHLHEQYQTFAKKNKLTTYLNPVYATTGSFHTLICGRESIHSDFLLLESDLLYHSDAIRQLLHAPEQDIVLCSEFSQSNDEVYVEMKDNKLKNLSKKKEELRSINAEMVGIWKISKAFYDELESYHQKTEDAKMKDYEMVIAKFSHRYPFHVLKIDDLPWCEIDTQQHLERAKEKILPRLD